MKKIVKPALISFLTSRPVSTIADSIIHNAVPVFMLHRVSESFSQIEQPISSDHLRKCLNYFVDRGYTFVSLEDLYGTLINSKKLPVNSIVFTMDDGYIDQAEIAAPIFLEYNCPVTIFAITGMLDQICWPWDAKVSWIIESSTGKLLESSSTIKKLNPESGGKISKKALRRSIQEVLKKSDLDFISDALQSLAEETDLTIPEKPPSEFQPMSWDTTRTLENQGVQFAPHSTSHIILSRLDQNSMEQEIVDSWDRLESELKNPLKIFCYPNGTAMDFGNREIKFLKDSGFMGAVSTIPEIVKYKYDSNDYIYSLPRLSLPDNMPDFIQYCSWIERARAMFT